MSRKSLPLAVLVAVVCLGSLPLQATAGAQASPSTVAGSGGVTGRVCASLPGPLNAVVTVRIYTLSGANPVALQQVRRYAAYRFSDLPPGSYVVTAPPGVDQLGSSVVTVRVKAASTTRADLGTCLPTVDMHFASARAATVRAFVARATAGLASRYAATYGYLDPGGNIGQRFFFAQSPQDAEPSQPLEPGDFAYVASYGHKTLKFVQRPQGDFECVRDLPTASWSCEGPTPESIGNVLEILSFDTTAQVYDRQPVHNAPNAFPYASVAHGTLAGMRATCLRFESVNDSRATWCITTKGGITAYLSAYLADGLELTALDHALGRNAFSLPAKVGRWRGYTYWPTIPFG